MNGIGLDVKATLNQLEHYVDFLNFLDEEQKRRNDYNLTHGLPLHYYDTLRILHQAEHHNVMQCIENYMTSLNAVADTIDDISREKLVTLIEHPVLNKMIDIKKLSHLALVLSDDIYLEIRKKEEEHDTND